MPDQSLKRTASDNDRDCQRNPAKLAIFKHFQNADGVG